MDISEYVRRLVGQALPPVNPGIRAKLGQDWLPHRFNLLDSDATMAYRAGHFELRAGAKAFVFRTSPKADYFYRGTMGGVFVGVRWYSD